MNLKPLSSLTVTAIPSETSTVFENIYDSGQRRQRVLSRAQHIPSDSIPRNWRTPGIVHLAPVAREVDPLTIDTLSYSFLGITPQGWMRDWDENGNVEFLPWNDEASLLQSAEAIVLSMEDIGGDENLIADMAQLCRVLVLTDGPRGARVYWRGQQREFEAPNVEEIDSTGSGDIFAACFFVRLQQTRDPWEAARFANFLAAASVTRTGLESVPGSEEIKTAMQNNNL
jgi:sugar/nucleoside kinase (ribokinase family)